MSKITVSPTSSVSSTLRSVACALPSLTERDASWSAPRTRLSLVPNAAMSPENSAHSQLCAPCRRARHQQISHIEAGDQQQGAGSFQEHKERLPDFAYHVLQQRTALGASKYEWVVEVRIVDALRNDAQIGHALRRADSRLQPPYNAKHVIAE